MTDLKGHLVHARDAERKEGAGELVLNEHTEDAEHSKAAVRELLQWQRDRACVRGACAWGVWVSKSWWWCLRMRGRTVGGLASEVVHATFPIRLRVQGYGWWVYGRFTEGCGWVCFEPP